MSSPPPPAFALPSLTPMALTAIASLLESVTRRRDDASYTPRGRLVALRTNGARLHVVCDGPHRSAPHDPNAISMPCVVLEAGSNSWSAMWDDVAADLGRVTRVLRYDRFGYGHSDDLNLAHMSSSLTDQTSNPAADSNGTVSAGDNVDENAASRCPFNWLPGPNHVYSSNYDAGSSRHPSKSYLNRGDENNPFANAFRNNPFEENGTTSSRSRFLRNSNRQGRHPNRHQHHHHLTQCSNSVERSPSAVAKDLCAMLSRVDASPPYIFVAHSLGALYINEAIKELGLGPDAVCGVVYIDPASRRTVRLLSKVVPSSTMPTWLARLLSLTGASRTIAPLLLTSYWEAFPPALREEARATWATAAWLRAYTAEWAGAVRYAFERISNSVRQLDVPGLNDVDCNDVKQMRADLFDYDDEDIGWLGNTPLAVLVPDIYKRTRGREFVAALQEKAALASNNSVVFRVAECGHWVQIEKPEAVVKAVFDVMRRAREAN